MPNAEMSSFSCTYTGYKPTQTLMKKKKQIKKNKQNPRKKEKKKIEQRTTNHGLPGVHLP